MKPKVQNKQSFLKEPKNINFILSFIGTIVYGISGIISLGFSQFSVYITSYFHHNNIPIDMQYGHLISPIILFSNSLSSPLGGFFEKKVGFYKTLIVCNILIEIIIFIFINQMNVYFTLLLIISLGVVSGICMGIPTKNLFYYFPKKGGTLSSFIGSSLITCGIIVGFVWEKIMNPDKYTLKKGEQFYPLEVSRNYNKKYN